MSLSLIGDVLGFLGAGAILSAYGYTTFGKRDADVTYHGLNLAGAILLGASLMINFNLASLCLEITWGLIALYGLAGKLRSAA